MSCFMSMRTDKSSRNQEVKKMFFSQYTFCTSNHIATGVAGYFPGHFWDIPHKNILIILWSMLRSNQLLLRNNFSLQNFVFLSLLAERWKCSGYLAFKSEIIYSQQTSLVTGKYSGRQQVVEGLPLPALNHISFWDEEFGSLTPVMQEPHKTNGENIYSGLCPRL